MHTVRTAGSVLLLVPLVLFLTLWPGCSAKKNYKTLSFFFDGVPKPGEKTKTGETGKKKVQGPAALEKAPPKPGNWVEIISRHPPYAERKCKECHNTKSLNFIRGKKDGLCYTCHKKEKFEGDYLHGPVAVGPAWPATFPMNPNMTNYSRWISPGYVPGAIPRWKNGTLRPTEKGKRVHNVTTHMPGVTGISWKNRKREKR